MAPEIEMSVLDLRYESCRMKDSRLEGRLLSSIAERGIEQPLEGVAVEEGDHSVLLNGFKRYRCARKLGKGTVPYTSLGSDEVMGILNLLRPKNTKAMNILEEARFIDELAKGSGMSVAGIAAELSRSKAWVSMRLGLVAQLSPAVSKELFAGRFPVYSYMYTLRPFMRMNGKGAVSRENREEVDSFVRAVSGKKLERARD
jgi:ParB-like chromosome segregation protein Spo0J